MRKSHGGSFSSRALTSLVASPSFDEEDTSSFAQEDVDRVFEVMGCPAGGAASEEDFRRLMRRLEEEEDRPGGVGWKEGAITSGGRGVGGEGRARPRPPPSRLRSPSVKMLRKASIRRSVSDHVEVDVWDLESVDGDSGHPSPARDQRTASYADMAAGFDAKRVGGFDGHTKSVDQFGALVGGPEALARWQVLYCGGSERVLEALRGIGEKYGVTVRDESFAW